MRLSDLAETGGSVIRDAAFASLGFVTHRTEGRLVFLEDARWLGKLAEAGGIAAVVTTPTIAASIPEPIGVMVADSPRETFYDIHEQLVRGTEFYGARVATRIAPTARVHERAWVDPMGVEIGEHAVIEANATVLSGVVVEKEAVIRAGAVVGSEGFQVLAVPGRRPRRVLHGGTVVVERGADVRGASCIDRALFGAATRIGEYCTLDHHVYVAHDVRIGARSRLGAGVVVNGSVAVGEDVWIGPNATISDGVTIGARASVSLASVVTRDVAIDGHVTGNFAVDHSRFLEWLRAVR